MRLFVKTANDIGDVITEEEEKEEGDFCVESCPGEVSPNSVNGNGRSGW